MAGWAVQVGFVVNKVTLGQVTVRVLVLYHVSLPYSRSFVCHRREKEMALDSVIK